ncbi:MAG: hypothetical protein JNK48_34965 [Bryobacterales bacterium]|nr:hypothetical protein [Bryobacterales bacterium]
MSYVQYGYRMRSADEVFVDLQRFVGFTKADLEANRAGRLTQRQSARLLRQMAAPAIRVAMCVLAVAAWYIIPGEYYGFLDDVEPDQLIFVPLFLTAFALYTVPWRTLADSFSPHIDSAEGKGDVEMRGVNDHVSVAERRKEWAGDLDPESTDRDFEEWEDSQQLYHLRVDGFRFPASKQVVNSIEEGHRYRAFYLRYSHRLLSIEPVSGTTTQPGVQRGS